MPTAVATTIGFSNFSDSKELITYAGDLCERKLHHLKNDVEDCLLTTNSATKMANAPAPYPAMLFSFSVIDMLGSLYTGSTEDQPNCERSYHYMTKVMNIEPKKASILLQIFQHKLLHFADPSTVIEFGGSRISWNYFHESNRSRHLQLRPNKITIQIPLTPTTLQADEEFSLSITDFALDIRNSVYKSPSGYLEILKNNIGGSQRKFDRAVSDLLCYRTQYPR